MVRSGFPGLWSHSGSVGFSVILKIATKVTFQGRSAELGRCQIEFGRYHSFISPSLSDRSRSPRSSSPKAEKPRRLPRSTSTAASRWHLNLYIMWRRDSGGCFMRGFGASQMPLSGVSRVPYPFNCPFVLHYALKDLFSVNECVRRLGPAKVDEHPMLT